MELGGAQDRPPQLGRLDQALGRQLGLLVAVGDAVHPDDRDVDQVRGPRGPGGLEQLAGALHIDARPARVAGAVDDRRDAGDCVGEPVAADQVAGYPLGRGWRATRSRSWPG